MSEETPHQSPKDEDPPIVTRDDIVSVIKSLPSRKAPGPDGIRNEQLKQLPLGAGSFLAIIFTACFRLGYFPQQWKKAKIICLPKPGKPPRIIESYRPISLLDSIGKLLERIILPHLLRFLAEENILPDFQFAFRREHCTHHALLRVTGFITAAYNLKACCAAAFLDVSKSFDRDWHEGLAWKLKHLRLATEHHCRLPRPQILPCLLERRGIDGASPRVWSSRLICIQYSQLISPGISAGMLPSASSRTTPLCCAVPSQPKEQRHGSNLY
jgi:hypothetical protein